MTKPAFVRAVGPFSYLAFAVATGACTENAGGFASGSPAERARGQSAEVAIGIAREALTSVSPSAWARSCVTGADGVTQCRNDVCANGIAMACTSTGTCSCGGTSDLACAADLHAECESRPGKNRCYCARGEAPLLPQAPASVARGIVELAAGPETTYALATDGSVWGWGSIEEGALPDAGLDDIYTRVPVRVQVGNAKHITAGSHGGCALLEDGSVRCWGVVTPAVSWTVPQAVQGIANAIGLSQSESHACAWDALGKVFCWGVGSHGELGDPTRSSRAEAALVAGLSNVKKVATGLSTTCALTDAGTVYCFGSNAYGSLGLGSATSDSTTPLPIEGQPRFSLLQGGGNGSFCASGCGGNLCWGANPYAALGIAGVSGSKATYVTSPNPSSLTGLGPLRAFGAGNGCAWTPGGTAHCWGNNAQRILANGTDSTGATPQQNPLWFARTARQIVLGAMHACMLSEGSIVTCWGDNTKGQLGDGDNSYGPREPSQLQGSSVVLPP